MSFARFNAITDDDLHASLSCVRKLGSPIHSASVSVAEGGGSSGAIPQPPSPRAGAAAAFDLENQEAIAAEKTADARTASSSGEGE